MRFTLILHHKSGEISRVFGFDCDNLTLRRIAMDIHASNPTILSWELWPIENKWSPVNEEQANGRLERK